MNRIEVDYSETAYFKGVRILYPYLEEGFDYVRKNRAKDVCIWAGVDGTKHKLDFGFLNGLDFIENFECIIRLLKKSNIDGLYFLPNLRRLRWGVGNTFDIDFSRFPKLETINTAYHSGLMNLDKLVHLKKLYIHSVKEEDCKFLSSLKSIELLRVINGQMKSLKGLEHCTNLKQIDLRRCFKLTECHSILMQLPNLESVVLDSKKHDIDEVELRAKVPHVYFG